MEYPPWALWEWAATLRVYTGATVARAAAEMATAIGSTATVTDPMIWSSEPHASMLCNLMLYSLGVVADPSMHYDVSLCLVAAIFLHDAGRNVWVHTSARVLRVHTYLHWSCMHYSCYTASCTHFSNHVCLFKTLSCHDSCIRPLSSLSHSCISADTARARIPKLQQRLADWCCAASCTIVEQR